MVEPPILGSQADDNIAQAFAIGELRKDHAQKLIPTGERLDAMIASVSRDALPEFSRGKMVEQLSENGSSAVHAIPSMLAENGKTADQNSNRFLLFWYAKA